MRRFATTLAAASLALAGCGGDGAESALDEALGHLPEDAPLAVIVSTDLESDQLRAAGRVARDLPFGAALLERLRSRLDGDGVDFEDDVAPLLGNEAVVGLAEPRDLLADDVEGFVLALETRNADGLEQLAERTARRTGETEGATTYRDGDTFLAVAGDVLVVTDGEERLRAALEQRGRDDRLREDDVERALGDLPEDAPLRLYGNVGAILDAEPGTAGARRVPFVDALDTLGATVLVEDGGDALVLDVAVNLDEDVEEGRLPLAAGEESPPVIGRRREVGIGIRDPARVATFAQEVAQAVSPQGFAAFQLAKRRLSRGIGVDLDRDLVGQFTGTASVAIDPDGGFAVRSQLVNPRLFERTLERLVRVIPSFAEGAGLGDVGVARPREGEDFYAVAAEGGDGVVYGVVDDVFVLASDARRAGDLVSEQPRAVRGAEGALVVEADAADVARRLLPELLGEDGSLPLGMLTASLAAGEGGLRGRVRVALER